MERRTYVTPACEVDEMEAQGMMALSLQVDNKAMDSFEGMANKNNGFTDIWDKGS